MAQTVFYVLGAALVAAALVLSAVGLRWQGFPRSRGVLVSVTLLVGALVAATAAFAWINAEDEQNEHAAELAAERQEALEAQEQEEEQETAREIGEGEEAPAVGGGDEAGGGGAQTAAEGASVFADAGCGGCHTLSEAGTTGTTGPDLDQTLRGKSTAYIRESIVDPNAEIAPGYSPDIMPQNYEQELTPEQLDALVTYLAQSQSG